MRLSVGAVKRVTALVAIRQVMRVAMRAAIWSARRMTMWSVMRSVAHLGGQVTMQLGPACSAPERLLQEWCKKARPLEESRKFFM
jgi:hypothetical protein